MTKKCPQCKAAGKPQYAPFCSKRCADIDLGRWFGGEYVIESSEVPSEEEVIEALNSGNVKGKLPE
jgi:uncharacterized protein